jgi:inosine-uridine nucleoside N-ribohydrolase
LDVVHTFETTDRTPIILDCDPGHDDALAIVLAARNPAIDLLAITAVAGNQTLDRTTRNARLIAGMLDLDVPIAAGCAQPLVRPLLTAPGIHGSTGLDGPRNWHGEAALLPGHAVEVMRDVLLSSPRPVTLVAVGPLTNIATLLQEHPEVRPRIGAIVIMGGSTERGNTSPYAEFNIVVDPEAADIVFRSGLPVAMCGLNVTHQVLVTPEITTRLKEIDSDVSQMCLDLMTFYGDTYRDVFGFAAPPLHDPVAVAAVIDPGILGWVSAPVAIELDGRHTAGATVVDLDRVTGGTDNVRVAVSIDAPRFWDLMIDAIAASS